ncbi:uncharacterized protein LOC108914068 [Anoplophora glabripennis]|uniref:uncharacterized protein LOC108914068 n=1 Tax=Anoplophora glabripennis TaxID=217634 RepID=UPI00087404C4|nr:uncharacterized protein LOC108914068 [Anoplophora glabripennis]
MEEIDDDTAILLHVVEDDEDNTENNKTDWGNYKPEDFKKPLHPKLLPKAKKIESSSRKVPLNETTATDDNVWLIWGPSGKIEIGAYLVLCCLSTLPRKTVYLKFGYTEIIAFE